MFPGVFEIVSVDSVQVYKYLNIGSGKLSKQEMAGVTHHLIDIVEPDYNFNVGDFINYADEACRKIVSRGKIPFFVGGTGLYLKSYFEGLSRVPELPEEIRNEVETDADRRGLEALHADLAIIDPAAASKIHLNDRQRIVRALAVYRGTGNTITSFRGNRMGRKSGSTLIFSLDANREKLYMDIGTRVDKMIDAGLLDEVKSLVKMGCHSSLNSMKSIGYAEIIEYLEGKSDFTSAVEKIKQGTRKLAKKQFIWFRRMDDLTWCKRDDLEKIKMAVQRWLD